MEKAYRVMRNSGAGNIAIGIILLVTGVTVGIISIINGASLLKHKNNNFLIHCEKGQSRSAGVGLAIECILKFNGNKRAFSLEPSMILNHHRYEPNMLVYDKILEEYNKLI